jgi:ribosomal protein S18 acetylase RimI-like enzyme
VTDELTANHQAWWRHVAAACDGAVQEVPGGLLVATGIGLAAFNQLHCDPGADEAELIGRAAGWFGGRGLPWRIITGQPSPAADTAAARLGGRAERPDPVLTLDLTHRRPAESGRAESGRAETGPAGGGGAVSGRPVSGQSERGGAETDPIEITVAATVPELRAFVDCLAASYRTDPALLRPLAGRAMAADPAVRVLLAGRGPVVAVGVSVRHGGTVGVYAVGVRRGHRRRGLGRAVTAAAIGAGAGQARLAVLQATPAGVPLYTAMGFRRAGTCYLWDFPR